MGVPKFYRWVSERYPCLSEVVKEFQIPEFDNLYLDMNGIVHVCSHPEDDNPHFRITEEKIFSDIMYYLEFLFRMIKPRKVFFMAVDGVAPRAKMNQQRGRRFRSAREAEDLEKKAMQKGETLPTEKRFDSNCITPGTPFMVRLQEQLKYFVVKKISQDPLWQGVRVYLSGHETPGEGEHKVMDFIRAEKARHDYDPNTRHCLYGLDADLMMLGLATHEPHFSLLREEVRFGGGKKNKRTESKRPVTPEETTFHLLHLSLFREYLDFEFSELRNRLTDFEYNLENIIDDWVLMGFLVGNDFIPHLPNLHINHDALPLLWRTYIDVLPSCGGYLNNGGHLSLERFEKYLTALSKFDFDTFSEQAGDLKWLESKRSGASSEKAELLSAARKLANNQKRSENKLGTSNQFSALDGEDGELNTEELGTELIPSRFDDLSEDYDPSDDFTEDDTLDDEFRHHKRNYYMTKMEYEKVTPEVLRDQAEGYVRGIQWILLYYYEGVPSWSWFYPHHYAPYMSDVKNFKDMAITFDPGTPFLPFEQLMAVLPAASKELLPKPYQNLMINDASPVLDFYPLTFETDLNGKQQDWEAVVLIPFIDENRLLMAIRSVQHLLTDEEASRNSHGPHLLYEYIAEVGDIYVSPLAAHFPDIAINHSKLTKIGKHAFHIDSSIMRKGLLPGAKLDVFFPGFPTLKHLPHTSALSKEGVKVFQMNSRGFNVMLHITGEENPPSVDHVVKEYLGKEIYVQWPHLYEAKVVEVSDDSNSYTLSESTGAKGNNSSPRIVHKQCDENKTNIWYKEASSIADRYKDRLGIVVGETHILLHALPMTGRKYIFGSHGRVTMEKQFGNRPVPFALQATVKDIAVEDPSFCQYKTLQEYLPEGSSVFMLGWPHYGCSGEVLDTDTQSGRVRINLSILEEPELMSIINNQEQHDIQYFPAYIGAQRLGISSHLVSRLSGNVFVNAGSEELAREQAHPHKVNVGLNLKFTKQQMEIPGFTKLVEGQWSYSNNCVEALRTYLAKFPEMVERISKINKRPMDNFYESEIIPKDCGYNLKTVEEYLKSLPSSNIKAVKAGADIISEGVIAALQSEADKTVEVNKKKQKRVKMQVKPHLLYRSIVTSGSLIPDSSSVYELFDRVVNTRQGFSVPFGLRGTVVGIHPADVEVNTMYEVIFDQDFSGGIAIRNSSNRGYRMPPSALLNLTHGQRKFGAVKPVSVTQQSQQTTNQGHRNQTVSYANAAGSGRGQGHSSSHGQGQSFSQGQGHQYGLYSRNAGAAHSSQQDNKTDTQQGSGGGWGKNNWRQQTVASAEKQNTGHTDSKPQSKERVEQNIFNGGHSGSKPPKFVTPKVSHTPSSGSTTHSRRQSQGDPSATKPSTNQPSATSDNSEFEKMWKQLQSTYPMENIPPLPVASQDTSLLQAAAALPRIPSPESENTGGTSTKIDVQSLFNQASRKVESLTDNTVHEQSNQQVSKKGGKTRNGGKVSDDDNGKSGVSRVVSNDEFAAMFKSLEEVQVSEEEKEGGESHDTEEDSSLAIKKMLNIAKDDGNQSASSSVPQDAGKSYGRQVSIQELFDGAKKQQHETSASDANPNKSSHYNQNKATKGQGQSRGQGQYNRGQGHPNQQIYQPPNSRPAQLNPSSRGGNRNPVMDLMTFCQSLQMGLPLYDYQLKNSLHFCVVTLNGARFRGSQCNTKEEAAESAASVALLQLRGSMQQMATHPVVQMRSYPAPGVQPQARQFSSPNSAFSPVTGFAGPGYFPGQQGQGGRGYFQGYNQQPFYGGQGHQQTNQGQGQTHQGQRGNRNQQHGQQPYNSPPQGGAQQQHNQQHPQQQYSQVKPQGKDTTNQNAEMRNEDMPLANASANLKQSKDGKSTCVVTPFVPLQVTRKQTPQKSRKESVSEDKSEILEKPVTKSTKTDNSLKGDDSVKGDNKSEISSKMNAVTLDNRERSESVEKQSKHDVESVTDTGNRSKHEQSPVAKSECPRTPSTQDRKEQTPPKSSGKKPRRRIAANFGGAPQ